MEIITLLAHKGEEGETTSGSEHGVLAAAGKIFQAFGGEE
jgi:hypothetical protein